MTGGDHKRKFNCNSVLICIDQLSSSEILFKQKNIWPDSSAIAAIISSFASSEIFFVIIFRTQTTIVKHPKVQNDRVSWSHLAARLCSIVSWSNCLTDDEVLDIILKQIVTSKLVSPGNVYMNRHQQFWNLWISEDSDFIKIELTQIWLWWNWMLA